MPRYPTAGITALSQLLIDADKDWAAMGISNLRELALGMVQGDLIARGAGGVLVRIPASAVPNLVLTAPTLPAVLPFWGPGGVYYARYFPVSILMAAPTVAVETADQEVPAIAAPIHSHYDLEKVVDGAVAEDTPAQVNETAVAQSAAANDMTLLPAIPVVNDAYYFGFNSLWDNLLLNIGTAGAGNWAITWEYYDVDTTWHALAGITDNTVGFTAAAGIRTVIFTRPAGWALTNIAAVGNMYWIRGRVSAFVGVVTQPLGTQAWCRIIT